MHSLDLISNLINRINRAANANLTWDGVSNGTPSEAFFAQCKPWAERLTQQRHPELMPILAALNELANTLPAKDDITKQACIALNHWIQGNCHMQLGAPAKALQHFEAADAIYRQQQRWRELAHLQVGRIGALNDAAHYEDALAIGQAAVTQLKVFDDIDSQKRLAGVYNSLGITCEHLGRYMDAIAYYQQRLQWWQTQTITSNAYASDAKIQCSRSNINIGVAMTLLGQYADAHALFELARDQLLQQAQQAYVLADIARADMNLAWLETLRQQRAGGHEAERVVSQAFARAKHSRDQLDPEIALNDLAFLDLDEINWQLHRKQAQMVDLPRLRQLRQRYADAELRSETWYADLLIGQTLLAYGQITQAYALFGHVAAAAQQTAHVATAYLAGVWQARAQQQMGQYAAACAGLINSLQQMENVRQRLNNDELRAGYLEDKLAAYQDLAQWQLQQGQIAESLASIERAKGRTLAEMLGTKTPSSPFSIEAVSQHLSVNDIVIAYAIIHGTVLAYLITADGLLGIPIHLGLYPTANPIRDQLKRITHIAGLPLSLIERALPAHLRTAQHTLAQWHCQFIQPILAHLAQTQPTRSYKRWLIVPDGGLHLPFAAFYNAQTQRYLIEDVEVLVSPSLNTWLLLKQSAVAPLNQPASLLIGDSWGGKLPNALAEVNDVAKQLTQNGQAPTIIIEQTASTTKILAAMPEASLLFISAHGVYREDAPALSYFLAGDKIYAKDILALRLKASLVILSACETAKGELRGNEQMGLVRAFLYAGAHTVLATHWQTDAAAARVLMRVFIRAICAGASADEALRQAQLACLHSEQRAWAHPFYWGCFGVLGA